MWPVPVINNGGFSEPAMPAEIQMTLLGFHTSDLIFRSGYLKVDILKELLTCTGAEEEDRAG